MQVIPITDTNNRLFKVSNLLPLELVRDLLSIDWMSLPWGVTRLQEDWPRREIKNNASPVIELAHNYIRNQCPKIAEQLGVHFESDATTIWWLDLPGFNVALHTDGELPATMQMFWIAPGIEYGTKFYKYRTEDSLLEDFLFTPNTGYLMLNQPEPDGTQLLQWHGMLNTVPEGTFRVTSYTLLGNYNK